MLTLKGQNLRIITRYTGNKYSVIAKSTSCTITQGTQTDDASTKDDTGMASKPTVTSKNWSVTVESLDVMDMAALLTAIKNNTQFDLIWDETAQSNNQSQEASSFGCYGKAILNDITFSFNDRENSAKQVQFTGISALNSHPDILDMQDIVAANGTYTKGQFVRLFLSSDNTATPAAVIGAAKTLQMHVSVQLQDATTKDTEDDWQIQEAVGISLESITSSVTAQDLASIQEIYKGGTPVKWLIANVSGANNRTKSSVICSGSCIITQLEINAPNRQTADYTAQLTGFGDFTVGS